MSGGKETPRQKMIGMMYLFLTAMLALNVSKDVLNSFVLVNDSLATTVENFNNKNENVYQEFGRQMTINEDKVKKWNDLAQKVKKQANELSEYMQELKIEIVQLSDGPDAAAIHDGEVVAEHIGAKDNVDVGAQIMVGQADNGKGKILKQKIIEFREFLLSNVAEDDETVRKAIEKNLDTSDPPPHEGQTVSWSSHHFEHMPLVAVVTMLTKMQSDVRNAEADILRYFYGQINAGNFSFNKLEAVVIPKSNYVLTGGKYEAEVFVAASDTTQDPRIYIGRYQTDEDGKKRMTGSFDSLQIKNGKGIYTRSATSRGEKKWGGLIYMKAPDGTIKTYDFEESYKVEKPTAIISASANKVFYYGVPNPLEVSVPGLRKDEIQKPRANNATVVNYKGGYAVKPTKKGGKIKVSLYAKIDGKVKFVGDNEFSVKQIPPPTPYLSPIGAKSGDINKDILMASKKVIAKLEGFIMEGISYKVVSYKISTQDAQGFTDFDNVKGELFSNKARNLIRNAGRGQQITFTNIKAKGPDGLKELSPLVFKIE